MNFYNLPDSIKAKQIKRVMTESAAKFTHAETARQYIELYEKMLRRPLIVNKPSDCSSES
jgi:starch synthase/alpha-amylase